MSVLGSEKPLEGRCGCKLRKSDPPRYCKQFPMKGMKVCEMHGAKGGAPIVTGLHSKRLAQLPEVRDRVEELRNDPRLLDGREQLALVLTILEGVVAGLNPKDIVDGDMLRLISTTVAQTQKTIESIHKIQAGYYLSPEKVQVVIEMLAARIQRQCRDCPKLPQLAADIQSVPMPE